MWTLDGIIDAQAVSSVPADVEPPTLQIGEDGTSSVFTGCNRGGAGVEINGSILSFGPMRLTKMACPGAAQGVEATVLAVLTDETSS